MAVVVIAPLRPYDKHYFIDSSFDFTQQFAHLSLEPVVATTSGLATTIAASSTVDQAVRPFRGWRFRPKVGLATTRLKGVSKGARVVQESDFTYLI